MLETHYVSRLLIGGSRVSLTRLERKDQFDFELSIPLPGVINLEKKLGFSFLLYGLFYSIAC